MNLKPVFSMLIFLSFGAEAQTLLQSFQIPPDAAKPRVWWHWMNGNITKEGIKKDLDWMQKTGIGGFQNFDANLFTPVVVPKKLVFMTPEWKEAFKYTTQLADQKGLEMTIAGSPGWSVTGGPWVSNQDAMKKYVWSETKITGGVMYKNSLKKPSDATGKFQNVKLSAGGFMSGFVGELPSFYADAMVIAYRISEKDIPFEELNPKTNSSGGSFKFKDLTDGDLTNASFLPPMRVDEDMWIEYEFETPQTFKAVSLSGAIQTPLGEFDGGPQNRFLKTSNDGKNYHEVARFTGSIVPQNTISFAPVTARFWRISFKTLPPPVNMIAAMTGGNPVGEKSDGVNVAEFVLHSFNRIDQYEDKAGFTPWKENVSTFLPTADDALNTEDIIDISNHMKADGSIEWQAPPGNWNIIRFGYSLTGRQNHPASPEATGLEVDKLDKEAVRRYINTYLDMYKDATGGMMGNRGLKYMVLDSYEAGHMTWTQEFPREFLKRRGYDINKWIPVLTGRIVKNTDESEKFLWDFRKTIGELIAENHYDVIGEELKKRGMKRYTESHEDRRIYLADGMDVKRNADIPMAAMWTPGSLAGGSDEEVRSEADIRESASVAHLYGKPIVAAESMTSIQNAFSWYPEKLKRTADLEMASGLNRFVIHTSVHQPLDDKVPGFSLGPFGQYFTRQETWSGAPAKAWMDYLGRSCHLLQQGKFVADILYFYGENTNITWQFKEKLPNINGYEYDFCNSTALKQMKVQNGKIIAPSGASYSLLILDESAKKMTLQVLKKIKELVQAGAKIAGIKPISSPSLSDSTGEFESIINEIWGKNPALESHQYNEVLKSMNVAEDVIIDKASSRILYVHRNQVKTPTTNRADVYWLNNRGGEKNWAEVSFRVSGKTPELWHPQTGKTEKVSYQIKDGRTIIPLSFDPWEAYFIVFTNTTSIRNYTKPQNNETTLLTLDTPWQVKFQEGRGAPESTTLKSLISFSDHSDPGIKYFSGAAVYHTSFTLDSIDYKAKYILDLGEVKNMAEVMINGKNIGVVWKTPFKIDISNKITSGTNTVEIKLTNLWVNRLIGDAQADTKQKITFTTMPFYRGNEPLLPSGLLGPVTISKVK